MDNLGVFICPRIKKILDCEIENGNSISEISTSWPEEVSVFIIMDKPFSQVYNIEGLEYTNLNDPHYWKEDYLDKEYMQIIACKFDKKL